MKASNFLPPADYVREVLAAVEDHPFAALLIAVVLGICILRRRYFEGQGVSRGARRGSGRIVRAIRGGKSRANARLPARKGTFEES